MNKEYHLYQFNEHLENSISHIIEKVGMPKTVIEIGAYQGYFTFNMTHTAVTKHLDYKHYVIDPYDSSLDLNENKISEAYQYFLHNLKISPHAHHIEHIRKRSRHGLIDLINRGVKADLIYVDGDHRAREVLIDMVLGFQLLNIGGVMLCDDSVSWCYTTKDRDKPLDFSPRLAVDSFIQCNWSIVEVMVLPNGYQSAFIKRGEG